MILLKRISRTCTNYETKGKPRKNAISRYRTCITTQCAWSGRVQHLNHSATDPSISRSVFTFTVHVNQTSWLRQNNDENFEKLQKYAFSVKDIHGGCG